jgi:predicted homoserine dehydrogenase-like protein
MKGPAATLENVSQIFALESDGGVTTRPRSIDFVQGDSMAGGVFITVRIEDQRISEDMEYLKVGKGNYFTFFRPYHLWFLEAPISVARAFLYRQTTLVPLDKPVADVITVAKRDLIPGDKLDAFGGYTFYGLIDKAENIRELNALPVGLAPGAVVNKPVSAGSFVTWEHVDLDENSRVVQLRREQDQLDIE